jgi:hypothetical protein
LQEPVVVHINILSIREFGHHYNNAGSKKAVTDQNYQGDADFGNRICIFIVE